MLTVKYTEDAALLTALFEKMGSPDKKIEGINAVLMDNDNTVGFAEMRLRENGVELTCLKIVPPSDTAENMDFFFRVILFKLTQTGMPVLIRCDDSRLLPFGFKCYNGLMTLLPDEVQFPSACKK